MGEKAELLLQMLCVDEVHVYFVDYLYNYSKLKAKPLHQFNGDAGQVVDLDVDFKNVYKGTAAGKNVP